jgi:hypothetical protein
MMIDVDRNIHSPLSKNGEQNKVRQFMMSAGQMSSAMEHGIFELMYQAKGVSTVQFLQLANAQGIPIYTITQNNVFSVLPILQISSEVKADIQNAINAGKNVIIPQQEVAYYTLTGIGYIILDSQTGAAAYMISTRLSGGGQCVAAGGLTAILLALIGSTGPGGSHGCTLIDLEHNPLVTTLQFLVPIGASVSLFLLSGSLFVDLALAGQWVALIPGIGTIFFGLLAAIVIYFMIQALMEYFSNLQNHSLYNRRRYARKYNVNSLS